MKELDIDTVSYLMLLFENRKGINFNLEDARTTTRSVRAQSLY